jgi:hypothetical protein
VGGTVTLHDRGIEEEHADAKAVAEAGAEYSALDLERLGVGKCVQPCRRGTRRLASRPGTPSCPVGIKGFQQVVGSYLCSVPQELAPGCNTFPI